MTPAERASDVDQALAETVEVHRQLDAGRDEIVRAAGALVAAPRAESRAWPS